MFDRFSCPPGFRMDVARDALKTVAEKRCVVALPRPRVNVGEWGLLCGHVWTGDVGYWIGHRHGNCEHGFTRTTDRHSFITYCTVSIVYSAVELEPVRE